MRRDPFHGAIAQWRGVWTGSISVIGRRLYWLAAPMSNLASGGRAGYGTAIRVRRDGLPVNLIAKAAL
jgi:hypothetical protein